MSNIVIKCQMLTGINIKKAVRQARWLGLRLGVHIKFDFNGHEIFVNHKRSIDENIRRAEKILGNR